MASPSVYKNSLGSVMRLRGGSNHNLSNITEASGGSGHATFIVEDGSTLSVSDSGSLSATNAPVVESTDAKVVFSRVSSVKSDGTNTLKAKNSNLIFSNIDLIEGNVPVLLDEACHANFNRIKTTKTTGSEGIFLSGFGGKFGSLLVQNTFSLDGGIHTSNMDVTLRQVSNVKSSGSGAAILFAASDAKGSYTLDIEGATVVEGSTALSIQNSVGRVRGATLIGNSYVSDSVVEIYNSVVQDTMTVTESTLTGTRTSFDTLSPSNSHIVTNNCTVVTLTPDASSVVGNRSLVTGDISGSNNAALWMNASKVSGSIVLESGSSFIGSAANLPGSAAVDASFMGSFGGIHGTVTTSTTGLALGFGSSGGSINAKAGSNVISAVADTITIHANSIALASVAATVLTSGTYSNTVTGTYVDQITGNVTIGTSGSYAVTAAGAVTISGNPTVTI